MVLGRRGHSESQVSDESHLSPPPPSLLPQNSIKHVSLRLPRRPRCRPDASHFLRFSKHHVDSIIPEEFSIYQTVNLSLLLPPTPSDHQRHAPRFQQLPPQERDISSCSGRTGPAGSLISDVPPCFERWSWIINVINDLSCSQDSFPRTISADESGNHSLNLRTVYTSSAVSDMTENRSEPHRSIFWMK